VVATRTYPSPYPDGTRLGTGMLNDAAMGIAAEIADRRAIGHQPDGGSPLVTGSRWGARVAGRPDVRNGVSRTVRRG
jgi:hypothetical protein